MPKTNYLDTVLLNHVLRAIPYTPPTGVYVALYTTAPTATSIGVEVTGGGYTRQGATFTAPASGIVSNAADVTYPIASLAWGTVVSFALLDAPTGGNMLYFGAFSTPRNVVPNDQPRFPQNSLVISEQ